MSKTTKIFTKIITILTIFSLFNFPPLVYAHNITPSTIDNSKTIKSCENFHFLFARGSGQPLGYKDYDSFSNNIVEIAKNYPVTYKILEIGNLPNTKIKYPAIKVDNFFATEVFITNGNTENFSNSIKNGISEIIEYTNYLKYNCPATKVILAGYSQGAMVVMSALEFLDPNQIFYVATFGDPSLYLPEGKGWFPPACRGENLSDYRLFAPDCRTYKGLINPRIPYHNISYAGKIGLWCNHEDIFCSRKINLKSPLEQHLTYDKLNRYQHAVFTIFHKIGQILPNSAYQPKNHHNLAILIDSTGSMSSFINEYKNHAIKLAKQVFEYHGKVALYEFRDLKEENAVKQLCDFSCNLDQFTRKINQITTDGGGDTPESAFFASKTALNQLEWQYGATKSIIILTDAPPHSPDLDGTTVEYLAKRALEIDPVNFYIVTNQENHTNYSALANLTSGKIFSMTDNEIKLSNQEIFHRPQIQLSLPEYFANAGDTITFEIQSEYVSSDIIQYLWDLDFDNHFETITSAPIVRKLYNNPAEGYMQVKAIDSKKRESTMSAKVTIVKQEEPPTLNNISHQKNNNSIDISYELKNASAVIVMINDIIKGINYQNHLKIPLKPQSSYKISLTPVSPSGYKGDPYYIDLSLPKTNILSALNSVNPTLNINYKFPTAITKALIRPKIPVPLTSAPASSLPKNNLKQKLKVPNTGVPNDSDIKAIVTVPFSDASDHHIHIYRPLISRQGIDIPLRQPSILHLLLSHNRLYASPPPSIFLAQKVDIFGFFSP